MNKIIINNKEYYIQDTLEYITLADSFLKNKIGSGHGEAKLYVGNENEKTLSFFNDISNTKCFFLKKDFSKFLLDVKDEYYNPQQEYIKKNVMKEIYSVLEEKIYNFREEVLYFDLYRVDVAPPRVYMNSSSKYYLFMRELALPNISYLSVLKLVDKQENVFLYFKIFIDYNSDILGYITSEEREETDNIIASDKNGRKKETIIKARIGQGEYRNKLLIECPFCPITLVNDERLLIASHIKPWAKSDDKEKIDPKNGFIFTPTYDKLFDKGFISFTEDKKMMVSPWLSPMNQKRLGIYDGKKIEQLPLDEKRNIYLKYHREVIFKA